MTNVEWNEFTFYTLLEWSSALIQIMAQHLETKKKQSAYKQT